MCYVAVPSVGLSRATDPDGDAGSDLGGWDEYDPALTPDVAMGRLNDEFEAALGGRSAIRWEVGFSFLLCFHVVGQVGSSAESLPGSDLCAREFPREQRFAAPSRAVRILAF